MLEVKNLSTYFFTENGTVKAVDSVSFKAEQGQMFGVAGDSGCGKSTVALSVLRLIDPPGKVVAGDILLDGINLTTLSDDDMRSYRGARIGMVFQDPFTSLNPVLRIGEQITEAILAHLAVSKSEACAMAGDLLKEMLIADPERMLKMYPHELSGGMRQRVMISMAAACGAKVIIADEPTTALDVISQKKTMELFEKLCSEKGICVILISHNLKLIEKYCRKAVLMEAGKVIDSCDAGELIKRYEYSKQ
jgi:peptide/nickel transport system ATP-binding protein